MIASAGLSGLTLPVPSSSRPQVVQVPGSNWDRPLAPVGLTAVGSQSDSAWIWAAITGAVISAHWVPDLSTQGTQSGLGILAVFSWPESTLVRISPPVLPDTPPPSATITIISRAIIPPMTAQPQPAAYLPNDSTCNSAPESPCRPCFPGGHLSQPSAPTAVVPGESF